ncbi:hypothetical protein DXG03_000099 [Asterophora parasitica]|uniref:Uncharacterized protein n=1 Tax=Asterophora parasitica TaxID=117018 RepID=A0A9P7GDU2_9AGAR|nr:hypothetical protein DXG03_000099 [Asterophora parasitica]
MKISALSLGLLAAAANAQYFSEGWAPGKAVPTVDTPPTHPTSIPQKQAAPAERLTPAKIASWFDLATLLQSAPAVSVFERFGINITERLEGAVQAAKIWDDRVTLITDHNYQDVIVNEPLTEQEEQDRTWILVISATAGRQDGISKYVDDMSDSAYNQTVIAGDLPNVRWGRVDYFNVTGITTKWAVWQAPFLVILRHRGQDLRFYRPHQIRINDFALRAFLQHEDWKLTPPWTGIYAPGGDREWIMEYLAVVLTKLYDTAILFPRWLLFIISGGIASFLINFLHKPSAAAASAPAQQHTTTPTAVTEASSNATATASRTVPAKRKKATKGK